MHNRRLWTSAEKIVFIAVILLLLIIAGGIAYVAYTDSHPISQSKTNAPSYTAPQQIKPTQPAANAKEGAAVETLMSPVAPGSNSAITINTNPNSRCTITLKYGAKPSTDSGLSPRTADDFGQVTWTWSVGKDVPPGKYPISVTCAWHGRTAVVDDTLVVSKS